MTIGSHATEVAFFLSFASVVWSAAFAWSRWLVRPRETMLGTPEYEAYLATRIARLEELVGGMHAQLAQLTETQRLTAEALRERLPIPDRVRGGDPPRVITPH